MVDVIATITGGGAAGLQTARAIRGGGGLVGVESTVTPPEGVEIEFLDWPFLKEHATVEGHLEAARKLKPKYAVAPDVQDDRPLDEALDIAERLARHAKFVIVVPKSVPVSAVPNHYIVGVPFRDEWDTEEVTVNEFGDFSGRPVHILGGNPTEQIELADRFQYRVTSVDSPDVFSWADYGRVWVARLGAADSVRRLIVSELKERSFDPESTERFVRDRLRSVEGVPEDARDKTLLQLLDDTKAINDLSADEFIDVIGAEFLQEEAAAIEAAVGVPSYRDLLERRTARVEFTVMNLVEAWNEGRRVTRIREVEPGRGPPPPAPEGLHGRGREDVLEQFLEAAIEEEIGRVEATRGLDTFEDG